MPDPGASPFGGSDLDPTDWASVRAQGHRMLDDMLDHIAGLREQPVWRAPPPELRAGFREALPQAGEALGVVHQRFVDEVLPYSSGNAHPAFMGWVQGGGTVVGMLGEMLAAGLNSNCGGRDHMALEVEQQLVEWAREIFGFPIGASGLFLTGGSQANFVGLLIARNRALGLDARADGLGPEGAKLRAYASVAVHGCVAGGMDIAGLGTRQLRLIPTGADQRINLDALEAAIAQDRAAGLKPFVVVGSAGTVDTGAVDDLAGLARIARREGLHFHVDGALGGLGRLSPALSPRLKGIDEADSIAFDWHKWGQVPYDAGFLLVRDGELHRQSFAADVAYLRRGRGVAGGDWWPCDYGPDLSRGFRALKTWFTLKTYGTQALGAAIERTCALADGLAARVAAEPELELLAPVGLNVVCFAYRGPETGPESAADADRLNAEIVARLQEGGIAVPSSTRVDGRTAIRAAIVNHRTQARDTSALADAVLALGRELTGRLETPAARPA